MTATSFRYLSRDALALKSDVTGARFWAVALDRTMLTYFEAPPGTHFEAHSHESEQITLVLEGDLFFELEGRTVCVRAGEVIAIPSNVPHAVYTREQSARAVDAWSPVMDKYRS